MRTGRTETDRWRILFGHITVYSLVVLLITGTFLTFFYHPDMGATRYQGSYGPLHGVKVSKAYNSTLHLSLEVRGGLLIRQVHHWAALVFTAAICCQLLRLFVTGAHRRPRVASWLIWVTLLVLAMAAGVTGTLLPDDMLSGGSLSLIQGVTESIPLVGGRLSLLIFGGSFPGHVIVPRAYWLHVAVLPAIIVALMVVRRRLVRGLEAVVALPLRLAMFMFTCAVLLLLGTVAQINPVWLYGPFEPGAITSGAVPDWYMGFLDGAVRIMPGWEPRVAGHPLTLAVLVPALIVPGVLFTLAACAPFVEARLTGDRKLHHYLDRPRDAAGRTATAAAVIAFYVLLWAAASNDQIAHGFHLSLNDVTWFFRVAVIVVPPTVFALTRLVCLTTAEQEREEAVHGRETGRIVMSRDGGFSEITERPKALDVARR